ncbi:hypothetical protein [Aquabacterium sp.]|jgi:hypothetical protein|uniref:hypothetical protein n=1 Tax=Aquabacterium sp. TaxID=1872578 RepID=UPI0025C0A9DD|nr:hypothetical protein [Aquabacterium sp.]
MHTLIDAPIEIERNPSAVDPHQRMLALACLKADVLNLFVTHGQVRRLADFGPPSPLLSRLVDVPLSLHVTYGGDPLPTWLGDICQHEGHAQIALFECQAGMAQMSVLHESLLEGLDGNEHDLILHTAFQSSTDLVLVFAADDMSGLRTWVSAEREDFVFKGSVSCALPGEDGCFLLFRRVLPL